MTQEMLTAEVSKFLQQEGYTRGTSKITTSMAMEEESHQTETALKVSLITMTCMVMEFTWIWKAINGTKVFGSEGRNMGTLEFMIELEEYLNV